MPRVLTTSISSAVAVAEGRKGVLGVYECFGNRSVDGQGSLEVFGQGNTASRDSAVCVTVDRLPIVIILYLLTC
jgi:hypothetical protein